VSSLNPKKKKKTLQKSQETLGLKNFAFALKVLEKASCCGLLRAWESLLRENFFPWFSNKNILKLVFTYQNY